MWINAYIIDGSKISMANFSQVTEHAFWIFIGEELCYFRITEATRPASNRSGHCSTRLPLGWQCTEAVKFSHRKQLASSFSLKKNTYTKLYLHSQAYFASDWVTALPPIRHWMRFGYMSSWKQEIWANAHETHESLWQFLFTGNLSLSSSISSQFTLLQPKIAKKSLKINFLGIKVIQGHQCWHF